MTNQSWDGLYSLSAFVMLRVGVKNYGLSSHTCRSYISSNRIACWSRVEQEWGYVSTAAIPQGHINLFQCDLYISKARFFSRLMGLLKLLYHIQVLYVGIDRIYSVTFFCFTWLLGCSVHLVTTPDGFTPIQLLFVHFVGLTGLVSPICCLVSW